MFDKSKFAQTLKDICETYSSQRDFSKKSEINRTYLSQYMNMKLDKPPKPEILKKIANFSNGITSYTELMFMCGYLKNEYENYSDLLDRISKSKAYIDCFNLLKSTVLTDDEITQMLYLIINTDIKKDEKELKRIFSSLLEKVTPDNRELLKIALVQYWQQVLHYRKEDIKFLNLNKDEQDSRFPYQKEMEGLSEEEIADALRFYKEMKKKINKDKKEN